MDARIKMDFGGIIKGIAVDHAINILREAKAKSAFVQIGGETGCYGISPQNRSYRMGIQHPQKLDQIWCAVHDIGHGLSLSTSGNYYNPIIIQGKEFYHIYDPKTGYPISTNILSVSVVFPEPGKNWLADGLSTAGVVLGAEQAIRIIEEQDGEALILMKDGNDIREIKSSGWGRLLVD
jgi:thiamine biosynthesis lipoprotein